MIDLHSHVLPGLDDGPADDAGALALARAAVDAGTRRLAATPHVDRHFRIDPAAIAPARERLQRLLDAEGIALEIVGGAEIALDRLVDLGPDERESLGLAGGPCLLVECPLSPPAGEFEWPVRDLLAQRVPVLLAHPERCPAFQREPRRLRPLLEAGAWAQLTAGSLRGDFGRPAYELACELAASGLVHDLASDAHNVGRRPPELGSALAVLAAVMPGGDAEAAWLVGDAPAAILDGGVLPPRPLAA